MKLKEQVCSLELAKKLKELGVKQDYKVGDWCYEDVGERLLPSFGVSASGLKKDSESS